ncbi:potassium transporter [Solibacillus merdavium]|uniref:Potassium transporter n=1 Tax=Solibacillus merdavium TaxID=2762218 RepID=A0ABR8XRG8_9BACL|nr:potassium transporter [Solibacillus merdavium]MBD8034542.1 potassium transporter [Solibacillus merdavium]
MNSISSSKNGTLLLVIALAMALLFAVYYYVVKPKQDEELAIHSEMSSLKTEISTLEETIAFHHTQLSQTSANEFVLRKKVPANREIDALILSIEEIEYLTGSRIQSIDFNNYDALVSSSGLQDPTANSRTEEGQATEPVEQTESIETEATESVEQVEDTDAPEELPVSTIAVETLPPSLKLITFNINVASPNDVSLMQFIEEIEKKDRVMRMDLIDYELPGEEDQFTEEASEIVTANIQITTFYYE